ncbi:unnamed protein product, partial [Adineta ricciae]
SYKQNENSNKERTFPDEFNQQLDQKVYEWFATQRSKNIPTAGPLTHEQAGQIRQQLDPTNDDDFKAIIHKYDPSDVYNADDSGLFFKALPNRSLVTTKET